MWPNPEPTFNTVQDSTLRSAAPTSAFMVSFYGELAKGVSATAALRVARLGMMRSVTMAYRDPY
jgi:CHAT domain-containing protein